MKFNEKNTLIFAIVFGILLTGSFCVKVSRKGDNNSKTKDKLDSIGGAVGVAKNCLSALASSMPPTFCWKKGGDAGVIPTGCPSGYFRNMALCYQNCQGGYSFWGGVCWQTCSSGYSNHGLSCYKNIFRWYFKKSYIPRSITNFSSQVPCPGTKYRSGALCYRDCEKIGMHNCGIGACTNDPAACASEIANMILKVGEGILTAVTAVVTFGASTGAKTSIKTSLKAAKGSAKTAAQSAGRAIKNLLKGKFKEFIKEKAIKKVKETLKEKLVDKAKEVAVQTICQKVFDSAINKTQKSKGITEFSDKVIDTIDIIGVKGIVTGCSDVTDGGLNCAKGVVDSLSTFDPTGLLSIASAFMYPSCEVPE